MGVFSFELPDELEAASIKEFSNSYLSGGPDTMPFYSKSCIHGKNLVVEREEPESALINCPWSVGDFGQFFCTSSTLMLKKFHTSCSWSWHAAKLTSFGPTWLTGEWVD